MRISGDCRKSQNVRPYFRSRSCIYVRNSIGDRESIQPADQNQSACFFLPSFRLGDMSTFLSHGESVDAVRKQVVETAEAMLNGQISFLLGARHLANFRFEAGVSGDDADFLTFVGIASETDSFPLGEVRKYW